MLLSLNLGTNGQYWNKNKTENPKHILNIPPRDAHAQTPLGTFIISLRTSYQAMGTLRLEKPMETSKGSLAYICAISQPKQSTVWRAAEQEGEAGAATPA